MIYKDIALSETQISRFQNKIDKCGPTLIEELGPCWQWKGTFRQNSQGSKYGIFTPIRNSPILVHRISYTLTYGVIPSEYHIHHKCTNTMCVNPDHLQALSPKEHFLVTPRKKANWKSRLDQCCNGHPFTEESSYFGPDGYRRCRVCRQIEAKGLAAKRKQQRADNPRKRGRKPKV